MRRLGSFLSFRVIPAFLVIAIFWTGLQVIRVGVAEFQASQEANAQYERYQETALIIQKQSGERLNKPDYFSRQFATNTPESSLPLAFNTATPDIMPTPVPTEAPTQAMPATPFVAPTFFPLGGSEVAEIAGTAVPTPVSPVPREYELINILLLGGDDEVASDNTVRTDTMIIVSVNTQTKTVAMLGLPRDLFVYVPTPTMTRLNTVYGIGESFNWTDGGFGLLRQVIFYNFGINVHYYAKVNFSGFETIIDTIGGVDVAVDCNYQDYYPVEDFDPSRPVEQNYTLRTLPVGYYRMNGFDALWYARTRNLTTDFDRVRRQQNLLRAIFRAGLQSGQLENLPTLWSELTQVVQTNIPFDVMLGLLPIALTMEDNRIEDFRMIRTYHTTPWQPTSGPLAGQAVQLPNYEPIRELLSDFYQPPTTSQLTSVGARVAVYNGTSNENWDRVAVDRLRSVGINAVALGYAEQTDYTDSILTDFVGEEKGSPIARIRKELNLSASSVSIEPSATRDYDYVVILGANYNSCTSDVLPLPSN